jgi:hypothetical protein
MVNLFSGIQFGCEDLFQYFESLTTLPTLADLEELATKLHLAFSSTQAIHRALQDVNIDDTWSQFVPEGTPWPRQLDKEQHTQGRHPNGDRVLSNSIAFMRDALLSQELSFAVAEGDVGRVYEILKVRQVFLEQ